MPAVVPGFVQQRDHLDLAAQDHGHSHVTLANLVEDLAPLQGASLAQGFQQRKLPVIQFGKRNALCVAVKLFEFGWVFFHPHGILVFIIITRFPFRERDGAVTKNHFPPDAGGPLVRRHGIRKQKSVRVLLLNYATPSRWSWYLSSISFTQASWSRYQRTLLRRPLSKVSCGCQPSSRSILLQSMA